MNLSQFASNKVLALLIGVVILLCLYSVNRILNHVLTVKYYSLIEKKGFIEAFSSGVLSERQQISKQYGLEYETLRGMTVISKTKTSLPDINPIIIQTIKDPAVLLVDYRTLLKGIKPKITLSFSGVFMAFPLSFKEQENTYIIFYKIFP